MTIIYRYALLIHGNEERHKDGLFHFFGYLAGPLMIPLNRIRIVDGGIGANHVYAETERFFRDMRSDGTKFGQQPQAILLYAGHGLVGHLTPNIGDPLSYDEWVQLLPRERDFLLINQSCYSGSAIRALKRAILLPTRGMVLASSQPHEKTYGNEFIRVVVDSYIHEGTFRKRVIKGLTDGEEGQKHFAQHPMRSGKNLDFLLGS